MIKTLLMLRNGIGFEVELDLNPKLQILIDIKTNRYFVKMPIQSHIGINSFYEVEATNLDLNLPKE